METPLKPIVVELEPNPKELGKLHDAQAGDIVASKKFANKVSIEIFNPVAIHGTATLTVKDKPVAQHATLLVFSFNPSSHNDHKRFKCGTVEFEFTEDTASPAAANAPRIVDLTPDGQGLYWDEAGEDWVDTRTWELNAKVGGGGGGVTAETGGNKGHKKEITKHVDFAAKISGKRTRSKDKQGREAGQPNVASFYVRENLSQEQGIPGIIRFAMLLTRPHNNAFKCTNKIEGNVDWPTNAKNAVVDAFSPKRSIVKYDTTEHTPEGRTIDSSKQEIYTDLGNSDALKKLASVKLPVKLPAETK